MGYIERRKALVRAWEETTSGRDDLAARFNIEDFDAACQPQVEALVEAASVWKRKSVHDGKSTDMALVHALEALDARADEVAGGCGEACQASRGERCPICGRGGK